MIFLHRWHTGNINRHTLVVSLFPALLIAVLLTAYFTYYRFTDLNQELHRTGQLLANQLAPAAEFGVVTGNREFLQHLLEGVKNTPHVRCINIYNQDDEKLASITKTCPPPKKIFKFEANVMQQSVNIIDPVLPNQPSELVSIAPIGRVVVVMADTQLRRQQQEALTQIGLLIAFSLILTLILAHTLARSLSIPLKRMAHTLASIKKGDFQPLELPQYTGEIGDLVSNINMLSQELKTARNEQMHNLAELTKACETAEQANRTKSDFLAMMSHELRTPMNGVLGMLQLIETTLLTDEQREYTQLASTSSQQLLQVINSILEFSRLENHALMFECLPFNLSSLFYNDFQSFTLDAKRRGIDFNVVIAEDLKERTLYGDPTRIKHILVNLLSNAFKFTTKGFVKVSCQAFSHDSHSIELIVKVTDSGIGIPKNRIETIFDAFSQADSSISRRYGGTGLGLSIAHKLAVEMGGSLNCSSQENVGTLFMLKLPLGLEQC